MITVLESQLTKFKTQLNEQISKSQRESLQSTSDNQALTLKLNRLEAEHKSLTEELQRTMEKLREA